MIIKFTNNYTDIKYSRNNLLSFKAIERTFAMLKPDSFERKLDKVILDEIKKNDFKILKEWKGIAPREKMINNYIEHKDKPFFNDWLDFLQSGEVHGMMIEGDNAVTKFREFAKSIRERFAPNEKRRNLIHSSDSEKAAERELKNFFDVNI